jgi:hypothetical protein
MRDPTLTKKQRRPPPAVFADNYPCLAHNRSESQTHTVPVLNGCRNPFGDGFGAQLGARKVEKNKKDASLSAILRQKNRIKHQ